ncbi:DUF445 family protein [Pandoraea nosoerga]|uniref:DUF445 domain-containing protein n=1 Tax=Pandoraea nosoerga TaxID=2508296 RepID=A0A5E4UCB5_9BURK|nr:DUF445 family protein [Pandoraea nosoerga]MBN4667124.1 DUF445 family protein [Pandoraea nosoerga]MBN4677113.1 DUF445 family protein [Pandoraea nosoerga]MBN4681851.1 DUF445 family protein [Pandoraea nosoerga]MBN4746229.1 DUF445 family protein [Pandoraea nosoerga]VVD97670.1 hypothetical protein PNO31109_01947 [Pandoraea nosoerga]
MDPAIALQRAERRALSFLLVALVVFIATLFMPPHFVTGWIRAAAEAAMVGGLADWFAVEALFRRIPIPGLSRHTNILIRKKDALGDGLARFVREKFLDTPSVVRLIRQQNPADAVSHWLGSYENTRQLSAVMVKVAAGVLDVMDERNVQAFIRRALDTMIDRLDMSRSAAAILDTLTRDGRHQALLDETLDYLVALLNEPDTREFISARIVEWLKTDHPRKEKVLPSEWIGDKGAEMISAALMRLLAQMEADESHQLRQAFDRAVAGLIDRLKHDAELQSRLDAFKAQLKGDTALNAYVGGLWNEWRGWVKRDLVQKDSVIGAKITGAAAWIGQELARSESLRRALDAQLLDAAERMAPGFADFVTEHIRATVHGWNAEHLSRQIRLSVGQDLQYIRINGTLVGGLIGAVLYLIAQAPELYAR